MKTFTNKTVVITGAGSGIGRALALECARLGARLAINDVDEAGLQETVSLLTANGVDRVYVADVDVADDKAMLRFADAVKATLGNAHVIINNAGIEGAATPAIEVSQEAFRRTMEINFYGVFNGCQAFLPQLVENNEGAVVNISSIFGLIGVRNYSDYCASKFAVRGYTEALMVEFHGSPIGIHCVHPGGIKTNIAKAASSKEMADKNLVTPPEEVAKYIVKSIKKKRARIVCGHGSSKVWFASRFLPMGMLKGLVARGS